MGEAGAIRSFDDTRLGGAKAALRGDFGKEIAS